MDFVIIIGKWFCVFDIILLLCKKFLIVVILNCGIILNVKEFEVIKFFFLMYLNLFRERLSCI